MSDRLTTSGTWSDSTTTEVNALLFYATWNTGSDIACTWLASVILKCKTTSRPASGNPIILHLIYIYYSEDNSYFTWRGRFWKKAFI